MEEVHKKIKLTQWGSQILTSILTSDMKVIKIAQKYFLWTFLSVFSDHHFWRQNWRQYLWTSLYQFNFFVNLLHSLGVSFFDNLTSFWQLDIFLTTWHLFDNLTSFWYFGSKSPMGPLSPCGSYPCTPLPMYPIAHMAHTHCTPYPMCPYCPCTLYPQWASLPICPIPLYPIAHVTHCLCGPYPLCPIAHRPHTPVPHCPYPLYPIPSVALLPMCHPMCPHGPGGLYPLYPIPHVHYWPMCPIAHHPSQGVWATRAMGPMGNGGTGGIGHMGNRVMCQNVMLSKRCQMSNSQISGLWRRFTKINKLT